MRRGNNYSGARWAFAMARKKAREPAQEPQPAVCQACGHVASFHGFYGCEAWVGEDAERGIQIACACKLRKEQVRP
jgi:hypothetical protein